jgi:hypothetical protein
MDHATGCFCGGTGLRPVVSSVAIETVVSRPTVPHSSNPPRSSFANEIRRNAGFDGRVARAIFLKTRPGLRRRARSDAPYRAPVSFGVPRLRGRVVNALSRLKCLCEKHRSSVEDGVTSLNFHQKPPMCGKKQASSRRLLQFSHRLFTRQAGGICPSRPASLRDGTPNGGKAGQVFPASRARHSACFCLRVGLNTRHAHGAMQNRIGPFLTKENHRQDSLSCRSNQTGKITSKCP